METLSELFLTFDSRGDSDCLIYRSGVRRIVFSYKRLVELSLAMNRWLAEQGVGRRDRVLLWGPNSPWWVVAFWGIVIRGGVVVPVDFMSGRDRAESIARLTGARLVIQSRDKLERLTGFPAVLMEELEFLLDRLEPLPEIAATEPDQIAQLIYTSGTTGTPKGVILTHRNLITNLTQIDRHIPVVTRDFTFLSLLPLSHMFEQMGGFFTPLFHGSAVVYLRTLKPSAIMEALGDEDIYAVVAVPRLLQLLKGSIEAEITAKHLAGLFLRLLAWAERQPQETRKLLFSPVRRKFGRHFTLFVSGGAPLDPDVFRFWNAMGFTLVEGYGLTECSPVLTANTMQRQLGGSVGLPLAGVELKIDQGEILAKGENVFPGYYENPGATAEAFKDGGWFRTGDLGELDSDGWLRIKGRSKELIVTGAGINVYPDEIEAILNRTAGVRESCVIGLDRGSGEEVHAVLILDGSGRNAEEVVAEANGRLDDLHRLTGFSLWPEVDFPKTTTMKIQKFKVKQRLSVGQGDAGGASADPLLNLLARITGVNSRDIREDSFLVASLGLTSIGRLELMNQIEQEFRLDLEDSAIDQRTRVCDLRRTIAARKKVDGRRSLRFWTNSTPLRAVRQLCDLLIHQPLLRCFVSLETKGVERLATVNAPVMFVANHISYLDQPAIMFSLPRQWRYRTATAAWEEFFFKNFRNFGQRIWKRFTYEYGTVALNLFPLPQSGVFRRALQFMGKLADLRLNILVFPEGERSPDGRLLPFRQGLGIMVRELGITVVPVKITGMEKVFPRGAHWPKRGRVTVTFGEPLRYGGESPGEIVEKARKAVAEL
jgi:long-chain acyl-CoA synthetase